MSAVAKYAADICGRVTIDGSAARAGRVVSEDCCGGCERRLDRVARIKSERGGLVLRCDWCGIERDLVPSESFHVSVPEEECFA